MMTRRAFFAAIVCGVAMPHALPAATGFHVRGVLSATDQEDLFYIGHQFGLIAEPRTEPHRLIHEMLTGAVRVYVEPSS